MAILNRVLPADTDDDNDKIRVIFVEFLFLGGGAVVIHYQIGRKYKKTNGFRVEETIRLNVEGDDWAAYSAAMTKNPLKNAEDWLKLKGIASE